MKEIHEIPARQLRVGDKLHFEAVHDLANWIDSEEVGEDTVIIRVEVGDGEVGEYVKFWTDEDQDGVYTLPDIRVCVIRER